MPNPALPRILNCRHALTAHITLASDSNEGLLVCQGGELAGWALFDGNEVGTNERLRITPMGYSMVQEGFAIGRGWGPPIAYDDYEGAFPFTGSLRVVELETDFDSQVWTPRKEWSKT